MNFKVLSCIAIFSFFMHQASIAQPTVAASPFNAILFDVGGVLAKTNTLSLITKLGYFDLCMYSLSTRTLSTHLPVRIRALIQNIVTYLAQRDGIGPDKQKAVTLEGVPVSIYLQDWQKGKHTGAQAEAYLLQGIAELEKQHFFTNQRETKLIKKFTHLIIDAQSHCSMQELITPLVEVVKKLKKTHPKMRLIIATDMDREFAACFRKKFPELIALFDDAIFSGEIGLSKPDQDFFTHIVTKRKLNPEQTLFVDNELPNIKAAQKQGIKTFYIHHKNFALFETFLAKQELIH